MAPGKLLAGRCGPADLLPALVRRLKQIVHVFDHGPNHIGAADNADQHAIAQDRNALDPMLQHQVKSFLRLLKASRVASRSQIGN